MGSQRRDVPASDLEPGDWVHDETMPWGARVVEARPMGDNPDQMFVELSSLHIVDRSRLLSIQRYIHDLDSSGEGGDGSG